MVCGDDSVPQHPYAFNLQFNHVAGLKEPALFQAAAALNNSIVVRDDGLISIDPELGIDALSQRVIDGHC